MSITVNKNRWYLPTGVDVEPLMDAVKRSMLRSGVTQEVHAHPQGVDCTGDCVLMMTLAEARRQKVELPR